MKFTQHDADKYSYNEFVTVVALAIALPPAAILWMKYTGLVKPPLATQMSNVLSGMVWMPLVLVAGFAVAKGLVMYVIQTSAHLLAVHKWQKLHRQLTVKYLKRLALTHVEEGLNDQTYTPKTEEKRQV